MKKFFATLLAFGLLAGCESSAPPPAHYVAAPMGKIVLNVASIDIVDHSEFQPSDSPYYVYHLQPTIAQAVHTWVGNSLQAGGTTGQAIITIEDASLSARALPTSDSFTDTMFKRQQASRYTGHVNIHMELKSGSDFGYADAEANHYVSLPEEPTSAERQNSYVQLLDSLMQDFNGSFRTSIQEHAHWAVLSGP